jgi:hypothetical protein
MQVYGVTPDTVINVTDLEDGTNPLYETALTNSTVVTQYPVFKTRVKNLLMYSVRLEGISVSDGTIESLDQVQEVTYELSISGQMR